jgi:YidC/Oxa1 family membrane protein insertase
MIPYLQLIRIIKDKKMNEDTRNLLLMLIISLGILFVFQTYFPQHTDNVPKKISTLTEEGGDHGNKVSVKPSKEEELDQNSPASLDRKTIISVQEIKIDSSVLSGSLSTQGGRINNLQLLNYHETLKKQKPIQLLSSQGTKNPYYAEFGWVSNVPENDLPNSETIWQTTDKKLTPESPVTLRWVNKKGVVFEKVISLDENYLFTIVERVQNASNEPLNLYQYGLLFRAGTPPVSDFWVSYEGPMGYLEGKKQQESYEDLIKKKKIQFETTSGWLGYSDKYWLGALLPDQDHPMKASMTGTVVNKQKQYQLDFVSETAMQVAPGQSVQTTAHFYAGPKKLALLDAYEKTLNIPHFDLAVDFGWFYFITKPIFYVLTYLYNLIGNFGLAIMALTVFMRLLFFPVSNKAFKSMAKMKMLQPEVDRIKELYADDKMKQQQEIMALFKKHKTNPASGCIPMLIQMPVFFALYKVIFISIEMRHAPFYGWIKDLSAKDPTNIFTLFGLINWTPPGFLTLGLLPLLMGGTMYLQQRLNPQPTDESQKIVFTLMPIFITFVMASFPTGLLLYWTWTNILGMVQQFYIMRVNSTHDLLKRDTRKRNRAAKKL